MTPSPLQYPNAHYANATDIRGDSMLSEAQRGLMYSALMQGV